MSVLWQTGEPPCGVELLIEYRHNGRAPILRDIAKLDKRWWSIGVDFRNDITVLRWSTLDAAPDVIGRLEKRLLGGGQYSMYARNDIPENVGRPKFVVYGDARKTDRAEAPSLAAAIEQLCGGTDGP